MHSRGRLSEEGVLVHKCKGIVDVLGAVNVCHPRREDGGARYVEGRRTPPPLFHTSIIISQLQSLSLVGCVEWKASTPQFYHPLVPLGQNNLQLIHKDDK